MFAVAPTHAAIPVARRTAALLVVAACAGGCGGSAAYRLSGSIDRRALGGDSAERHRALVAEGDALWQKRSDPAVLARALDRWHDAIRLKDDDWQTYARLSRGYFFQAEAVHGLQAMGGDYPFDADRAVDPAAVKRYLDSHQRGFRLALRGMAARSPEFEQRLRAGIDIDRAIRVIRKDSAALLYWYVTNLARWSRADGLGALINNRNRILSCIRRLRSIDPGFYYRGADRLLGIYYAAAPALVGGNLDRARVHFEAALRAAPDFLPNQVFVAEFLDRRAKDRRSFEQRLRSVLAADNGPPEIAPENLVAKRMARRLLSRLDRYFPPAR
jgi:hypothetical protein